MTNTDQHKSTLSAFMQQVWNQGNFDHLSQFVCCEYQVGEDNNDPWGGQIIDHETFKKRVMYSRNAFSDLNFFIQSMIAENQTVAIQWIMTGTHNGDLPQLSASGKSFAVQGMTMYEFKKGKISGHQQCFDQLGFLQQIGAFGLS